MDSHTRSNPLEHQVDSALRSLRDMWRRRLIGAAISCCVGLLAALALLHFPDKYEARARVYVDTQTIIQPLLQGLTVQPDIDQIVGMLARTLISRPNIERLLVNTGLDSSAPTKQAHDQLVDDLIKSIKVTPVGGKNLYDIVYRDTDSVRAQRVVAELVALFVNTGASNNLRDTAEAQKFIDEQVKIYESKLEQSENRLKEFKLRNVDITGAVGSQAGQDYFARIASIQQDLAQVRIDLGAAEQARDSLQRQLAGEDAAGGEAALTFDAPELDARLETQRKQLDELRRRYTDNHPDVIAARHLIEQLERERSEEMQRRRAHPAGARELKGNIVYEQIKIKLAEAQAAAAALKGRQAEMSARLNELRASASRVPQVEAELAQLNRDYDVIKKNYEQLVQRRESASISGHVDEGSRLADFRIIEPARLAPKPVFPARRALVPLALLLALGTGAGACYALNRLRPTFSRVADLHNLGGRPILGAVSMFVTPSEAAREQRTNVLFAMTTGVLVLAYGIWIVTLNLGGRL